MEVMVPEGPPEEQRPPSPVVKDPAVSTAVDHPADREQELRREYGSRRSRRAFSGRATYYHDDLAEKMTACGEPYDPNDFTAAHRSLPFGTILRVELGGRDVFVRVNDRGPFGDRKLVLDLSRAAAERVGLLRTGVARVRVEIKAFGSKSSGRCGWPAPLEP